MELSRSRALQAFEWTGAGILSIAALILHFRTLLHAGPLWRDEISSLKLATMPTLRSAWATLVFDPAPAGFFSLLRLWTKLGFGNTDLQLRILGFLIGCAGLLAIWTCARKTNRKAPLWPLALFALNPVAIQYGDSLRGYGLGVLFALLTFGGIYRVISVGGRKAVLFSALCAIGAVQSVFTNAILVFAVCAAAVAVLARAGKWRGVIAIGVIGVAAASTLLPYIPIIRQTTGWSMLVATSPDYLPLFKIYAHTLGEVHFVATWATCIAGGLTIVMGACAFARTRPFVANAALADQLLFASLALVIGTLGTLAFFWHVGWPTSVWYYLPLAAMTAACIHVASSAVDLMSDRMRLSVNAIPIALALALLPSAFAYSRTRSTNADFIADAVAQRAAPEDLVLVNPYFYAVSFQRYYHGSAPWSTVPAIADYTLHRWDLLKEAIASKRPELEVLARVERTLRNGHRVFLVGSFPASDRRIPPPLPPAPTSRFGWMLGPYITCWSTETSYTIAAHATNAAYLVAGQNEKVNTLENLRSLVVEGWRDDAMEAVK